MSGAAIDVDLAPKQKDSLPHAGMTEAHSGAMLHKIEAGAIIAHGKLQAAVHTPQGNLRPARSGMAFNVAQRLLRDAKEAERGVAR